MKTILQSILFFVLVLSLNSCSLFDNADPDSDPDTEYTANEFIYAVFDQWYLWYDEIPEINPNSYDSYSELIDAISVDQDRWSRAGSYEALTKYYEEAESKTFGAGFIIDWNDKLRVTYVYDESPLARYGVERGWIVESVNGFGIDNLDEINAGIFSSDESEFVFTDLEGNSHTQTFTRETITMNTVLYSNIYEQDSRKIGYLVFDSFLNTSEEELKEAFQNFSDENITDLIVDLRYNGGGSGDIAEMMVGMIGADKVDGQIISKTIHNDKQSFKDNTTTSNYSGPTVNIDEVYFITTNGSASASELVINALEPFMNVTLIGSNTHGKPVGMYVFPEEDLDLAVLPICLKIINADGYGDYYNGLPADYYAYDDVTRSWGDLEENMLKTAISAIVDPASLAIAMKSTKTSHTLINPSRIDFMFKKYHE